MTKTFAIAIFEYKTRIIALDTTENNYTDLHIFIHTYLNKQLVMATIMLIKYKIN